MSQDLDRDLRTLKQESQARERQEREHSEVRKHRVETEYRLRALELQLQSAKAELTALEGFSLTGLMYGLSGKKGEKQAQARQECEELEKEYGLCAAQLEAISREAEGLERSLEAAGDADAEYTALLAKKQEQIEAGNPEQRTRLQVLTDKATAANCAVQDIERVMAAGEEAIRDIHSEMEVVSTLGRCRSAEGHRTLKSLMNASRRSTSDECAGRVRQSIRRFLGRLEEYFAKPGSERTDDLRDLEKSLSEYAEQFAGFWLTGAPDDSASAQTVEEAIRTATMHLEQQLNAAKELVKKLESERRSFIESA